MSHQVAALFKTISSGVYVVGAAHGQQRNAFTASWVMQASFNPLMLSLSINPGNTSYRLIKAARAFAVSVLAREQMDLARHFGTQSGREHDKLAGQAWRAGITGAPILSEALSYFDCRLCFTRRAGDHVLVVGRVIDGAIFRSEAAPMTYASTGDLDGSGALYPSKF